MCSCQGNATGFFFFLFFAPFAGKVVDIYAKYDVIVSQRVKVGFNWG